MVDFDELTEEQREAADALDRNVTLTAGAGTGKTTTLTARYMRMLERGMEADAPADANAPLFPEEIVTTTFTERAANELKQSVREAILDRVADAPPAEYAAWRDVADGLEEGYIHTLHGFCSRLLREHALSVDAIDPGFDTLDESETTALLDETVATLLETHDDHEAVQTLARRYSRSALQDIITDLLTERPGGIEWAQRWAEASREEYLTYVETEVHPVSPELAAERLANPSFVDAVATLQRLHDAPPDALETGGRAWTRAADLLDRLAGVQYEASEPTTEIRDCFLDLCAHLTTGTGERYSSYTGAKGRWSDTGADREAFDTAMETIVDVLEPEDHLFAASVDADANSFPFVQALARVTLLAHEAYTDRKRRQNVVDFTDQVELALEYVTEIASDEERAALRDRFAYVMVDEFQDTDPRQWDLITHLTADDPDEFDARNVFVVGDVKQSIYRFRNADVTQFGDTERDLAAANPTDSDPADTEQLSTNFRTLPGVLEFVNRLFDELFEEDGEPYEAKPQPLTAYRDDPEDLASAEYLAVPTDPEYRAGRFADDNPIVTARPEHDAELEAMALAARLTQLFDEPARIYDEDSDIDDPDSRDLQPDDVAILLRSRTHLKRYERALEDAGIPFTVASGLGFYETPEITALLNLFRVLADPADERALYGALRSPLFGHTDDTLAMLKRDDRSLWRALEDSEHGALRASHELLQTWREALGLTAETTPDLDGSWASFLTRVIDETGYLATVSADERPQQAVANVEKFREQLREFGEEGVTSLPTLVRRIERLQSLGKQEGEATIQGGGEGVKILTVHDAKGMEFPFVVVPGIGRGFNMKAAIGSGRIEFEQRNGEHVAGLKAPDPADPFEMKTTVARETLKRRRKAEERAEERRVLYVAATRARDRLLLTGLHDLDGDSGTLEDIKSADPEAAGSWRDWIQPHVLTDETILGLEEANRVTGTLHDASFTVSLPTAPVDWAETTAPPKADLELSSTPPNPSEQFRLSPTALASLFDGYGSLRVDDRTNTVFYEGDGEENGDNSTEGGVADPTRLPPTVFGEMVHRLCELRPPSERVDDVLHQVFEAEDAPGELRAAHRERVVEHATRAIEYVDERHAESDVVGTYDELSVTAEFATGEISGLIDHLVVTPDEYHVIDYKTNDIEAGEIPEEADYYRTQMEAYAIALHQQDSTRAVAASLYFTTPGEVRRFGWTPSELSDLESETEAEIQRRIPTTE
ncbi:MULTISPECIES: UvrD-helicase domain-containing protein [Haloarcula]|uniref:UvrD-helicase domain-containing protein n=1 Tax=Haloarcula TaxID=2237 RepID=UPI0023EDE2A2|nr:UvrD-helicase domain-containing protein [Halomicroarcula sp. XH51]